MSDARKSHITVFHISKFSRPPVGERAFGLTCGAPPLSQNPGSAPGSYNSETKGVIVVFFCSERKKFHNFHDINVVSGNVQRLMERFSNFKTGDDSLDKFVTEAARGNKKAVADGIKKHSQWVRISNNVKHC